jgi:hypothetical protein
VTPGNLELLRIVASWTATVPAVATIIVRDERRLRGDELARAWPAPSRDAAIFGLWNFGVHHLCVLVHFARTRRTVRGASLGLLWLVAIVAVDASAQIGVATAVGWAGW